ncbi:MAG TPA: hypothetical protein VNT53_00675 [Pseudolysinimonas sp.]|nr:hypothetical protein [Pseudolysinimonas sp.]
MSPESQSPLRRLGQLVWAVLGSAFALWLAVQLLAQIWGWLLLLLAVVLAGWALVRWLSARRDRW